MMYDIITLNNYSPKCTLYINNDILIISAYEQDLRSQRRKKALEISHQWYQYKRQADDLLKCLDDIEKKLASLPEPSDERKIKVILLPNVNTRFYYCNLIF